VARVRLAVAPEERQEARRGREDDDGEAAEGRTAAAAVAQQDVAARVRRRLRRQLRPPTGYGTLLSPTRATRLRARHGTAHMTSIDFKQLVVALRIPACN
jgi:hypothetical protein